MAAALAQVLDGIAREFVENSVAYRAVDGAIGADGANGSTGGVQVSTVLFSAVGRVLFVLRADLQIGAEIVLDDGRPFPCVAVAWRVLGADQPARIGHDRACQGDEIRGRRRG